MKTEVDMVYGVAILITVRRMPIVFLACYKYHQVS